MTMIILIIIVIILIIIVIVVTIIMIAPNIIMTHKLLMTLPSVLVGTSVKLRPRQSACSP